MKSLRLLFMLFFGSLLFFTCQKSDNYNVYTISPEEPNALQLDTTEYVQASLEHVTFISGLLARTAFIIYSHPDLNGLVDQQAEVRACPNAMTSGAFTDPGGLIMDVEFDNCTPIGATFGHTYDGNIDMVFDVALGEDGGTTSDFTFFTSSLTIDNGTTTYTITMANPIKFDYDKTQQGDFEYEFVLSGDITVSDGTYTTTYPSGMTGTFEVEDMNDDDTDDPITYLDNNFLLGIDEVVITCNNGTTDMPVCLQTQAQKQIEFDLSCGCPKEGVIQIDTDGDCDNFPNDTQFDFGDGTCDSEVENGNGNLFNLDSCSG